MPSRPRTTTLFPYTTLFRSFSTKLWEFLALEDFKFLILLCNSLVLFHGRLFDLAIHTSDRKSTRLNSSHMSISYAVFCLKIKNYVDRTRLAHRHPLISTARY